MTKLWRPLGLALAIALLGLSILNASWLAPDPVGGPRLIAHRGIAQEFDRTGVERDTCTATLIEEPMHDFLENTVRSMREAQLSTAQMIEIDIAPTADGEIAVFHDWTLDCRTNGTGPLREATMAQLKALDAGYGYTADGGTSYPLRGGNGVGAIPSLEEVLAALPRTAILFNFKSGDPAEADLLAEKLRAAGRDVEKRGDGFYGHPDPVARIREHFPEAWAFDTASARECSTDYALLGWSGYMPESCRNGTMVVPLNRQFPFWGWPNRLIARAEAHNTRILVTGPYAEGRPNEGLLLPEQFGEIPSTFNGYIWVEDLWNLGPSLRPSQERRSVEEQLAGHAGLERRRARMEAR